jgi:hypothetical protein
MKQVPTCYLLHVGFLRGLLFDHKDGNDGGWHVPLKWQLTFNRLHGIISQKTELFFLFSLSLTSAVMTLLWLWNHRNISSGTETHYTMIFLLKIINPLHSYLLYQYTYDVRSYYRLDLINFLSSLRKIFPLGVFGIESINITPPRSLLCGDTWSVIDGRIYNTFII